MLKTILSIATIIIGAAVFGTPTYANDAIRCVQQGLLDAGFDPNGVDGAIGGGTRNAAEEYLGSKGSDVTLPPLSAETATQWCTVLTGYVPQEPRADATAKCSTGKSVDLETLGDEPGDSPFIGVWNGSWDDGNILHTLIVTTIRDDGSIAGFYANDAANNVQAGCWRFSNTGNFVGRAEQNAIVLSLGTSVTIRYEIDSTGMSLSGTYSLINQGDTLGVFYKEQ